VRSGDKHSLVSESAGTRASQALTIIAQNIDLAADGEGAICQDTGMPTFEVHVPVGSNQIWMRQQIREAVKEATKRGQAAAELGRFDHGKRIPATTSAPARRSFILISGRNRTSR